MYTRLSDKSFPELDCNDICFVKQTKIAVNMWKMAGLSHADNSRIYTRFLWPHFSTCDCAQP